MKIFNNFVLLALTLSLNLVAAEDTKAPPPAANAKIQNIFSQNLVSAKKALKLVEAEKKKTILAAEAQSQIDQTGIEAFKKYDVLLGIRYANAQGEYQGGFELAAKDKDNMNKMFDSYLRTTPFLGRVSVGHGRHMIQWGIKRLEELSKIHAEPTEANNPELEIAAKQVRDSELKVKAVVELAGRMGISLSGSDGVSF